MWSLFQPGFSPNHFPGCVLWLDPTVGLVSGGGLITQITDRSSAVNNATAAGADRPPVDAINGEVAYLLDGGVHAVPTLAAEITTSRTLFFVYDRTGLAMPPTLSSILGSNATFFDFAAGATQPHLLDGANVAQGLRGVRGGGTAEIRVNGDWEEIVREDDGVPETVKPSAPTVITLMTGADIRFNNVGMDRVTSRVDHSRRGDLIVYNNPVANLNAVAIEKYLLAKYRISPVLTLRVVVFTGNSIVAGQGVAQGTQDFPSVALTLLNTPGAWKAPHIRAYNKGAGGQTTAQMLIGDRVAVDRKLSQFHPANVVIIFEGSNDLYSGATAATALANLLEAYSLQRGACPGTAVGVGTILPRSQGGTPASFNANRAVVNAGLQAALGTDVVDFAADPNMGSDGASDNATYYQDGTHPTVAGQAILGTIAAAWINGKVP